ncbi:amino acid adenylation domain-containing protein, partial [Williamsia sp.]|uniref:amino acid adenylation domain-containing protein n=1 Tax=Williamsia sp. TaxID=1872085 RepID=UPI001A2300D6
QAGDTAPEDTSTLRVEQMPTDEVAARLDLTLTVATAPEGDPWTTEIVYATDLFDESSMQVLAERLLRVLDALVSSPSAAVGDVDLLDAAERRALESMSSGPQAPAPHTVVDLLDAQRARTPDAVAVVVADRALTYRELGAYTDSIARSLIARGVGTGVAVGVCLPRSVEMMVAIHAVVRVGGQYVPIDVDAPAERVRYMIETAGVGMVLVGPAGWPVPDLGTTDTVVVDCSAPIAGEVAPLRPDELIRPVMLDDAAYTIFTSGSTGRPKGVTVSHRAIANRLQWLQDLDRLGADDVVLQKTPITFDVSVGELFGPFIAGARLVLSEPGRHADPAHIASLVREHAVTTIHFVPSMMALFVEFLTEEQIAGLASLRRVLASGEAVAAPTAHAMAAVAPAATIRNLYGPTEAAVEVTAHTVVADETVIGIGEPMAGTITRVLDARLQPVPVGVVGELYLGGVQLARGYASRPDLTADRFVADPAGSGTRLYRTGDLVRWNRDSELEYLGRGDFQVKLRGQRIELGEIETVLMSAPGVRAAAATVVTTAAGDSLVGYVSGPNTHDPAALDQVREHVARRLPAYMRPTMWMVLDDFVHNSAGKIDRRALPAPETGPAHLGGGTVESPRSPVEDLIAGIVADVLGIDAVSVTTGFFELGGNSLSAMRVVARIGAALDVEVGVRELFDHPTVRELAQRVSQSGVSEIPLVRRDRPARIPLSHAQGRIWFLNQFDVTSTAYDIPIALRLVGDLDVAALRAALDDVMLRHEPLRTVFPLVDGEPSQQILDPDTARRRLDWRVTADPDAAMGIIGTGVDVTRELPIRARIATSPASGDREHLLVLVVHHIAGDAHSLGILAGEMMTAYTARRGSIDDGPALPAPE